MRCIVIIIKDETVGTASTVPVSKLDGKNFPIAIHPSTSNFSKTPAIPQFTGIAKPCLL